MFPGAKKKKNVYCKLDLLRSLPANRTIFDKIFKNLNRAARLGSSKLVEVCMLKSQNVSIL